MVREPGPPAMAVPLNTVPASSTTAVKRIAFFMWCPFIYTHSSRLISPVHITSFTHLRTSSARQRLTRSSPLPIATLPLESLCVQMVNICVSLLHEPVLQPSYHHGTLVLYSRVDEYAHGSGPTLYPCAHTHQSIQSDSTCRRQRIACVLAVVHTSSRQPLHAGV